MKQIFITGGLGNQMFQYALMISLQNKGIKVEMNTALYHFNKMHNGYMLGRSFGIYSNDEKCNSNLRVFWSRAVRQQKIPFVLYKEVEDRFCEDVFSTCKPYIDGCWINPRYFEQVKDQIRSSFSFKDIDSKNLELADKIQSCNSVSIHIRRGDYTNNPMYNVCNEEYYRQAINYIVYRIQNPKFFVFSDDPTWCEGFMQQMGVSYQIINHNTFENSYKDMYLMTQCKHNIMANSTFSWWGAWLGSSENRIVVCPDRWINGRDFNPCLKEWYHIK